MFIAASGILTLVIPTVISKFAPKADNGKQKIMAKNKIKKNIFFTKIFLLSILRILLAFKFLNPNAGRYRQRCN